MTSYLQKKGWVASDDQVINLEKPGEGNMNMVLRATTNQQSLILKQANPFVQKYPDIPAPVERIAVESKFYEFMEPISELRQFMPALIGFDAPNRIMAVEDLGVGADFTFLYQKGQSLDEIHLKQLIFFLSTLHNAKLNPEHFPDNLALRQLNHEHLFSYPYMEENGFDLDSVQPGLQTIAMTYKTDDKLKAKMQQLGTLYLSDGKTLLHGDYYPGSWLKVNGSFKVIDPEFCHFGRAEYDLGVLIAHLFMAQMPVAQVEQVKRDYLAPLDFDWQLCDQFTGMEIMRRIIGLAQLPLDLTLEEKEQLLKTAYALVL